MIKYILDTNIISEPIRPQPDKGVLARLKEHEKESALTTISWHELVYGVERLPDGKRKILVDIYLNQVVRPTIPILPYDQDAAAWHANERARLEAEGQTPSFADSQIASIAATQNLILVTRNVADFSSFNGLHVENWFEHID